MARTLIRGSSQVMEQSVFNAQIAPKDAGAGYTGIQLNKIENSESIVLADGTPVVGNIDMGAFRITNVGVGISASDVVVKSQLDSVSAGLDPKESVRVATTANITLSGLQTIDGVALVAGDRVLVKDQTNNVENGIYDAAGGAWVRSDDFDGTPTHEVSGGAFTFVEGGTQSGGTGWVIVTDGVVTIGTDPVVWTQFAGAGTIIGGLGIYMNGNEVNADVDNLTLTNTGGAGAQIAVRVGGIANTNLAADSVSTVKVIDGNITAVKINADIAGVALTKNVSTNALDVRVDGTAIVVTGNNLTIGSGGVLNQHYATASITGNKLDATVAGDGLIQAIGGELEVNVDNITIEIAGDALRVKANSINTTHLVNTSVTREKINADVAGDGLVKAVTGELDVNVDGSTIVITADVVGVAAGGITETQINSSTLGFGLVGGSGAKIAVNPTTVLAASNYVVREPHNATIDGQTVVTLNFTPAVGTEMVFVNGILMESGAGNDYNITGSTITFNFGLQYHATLVDKRDKVSVTYFKQA